MEIYVKNSMEKIDERTNMTQNMMIANDMKMKTPMEKAMSMPNMENKMKRLHDNLRSESETSFDHKKMNEAHMKNLGKAYDSPQNKGIAQSFRYMRNKPTIIAFKTPSLETFEANKNDETKGDKLPS